MSLARKAIVAATVLTVVSALASAPAPASAAPPNATYTISVGSSVSYAYPDDSPASPYVDKDGTFYFQQSYSNYGVSDPHQWSFYTGTNFDTATDDTTLDNAVNPANSADSNNNTTWRCDNGPTGVNATASSSYPLPDYCDLIGTWVDPDTGTWYGLVHNEFTGDPFAGDGGFTHFDAIDYAVSTNQGKVWTITGHAITSPYSTARNNSSFPNQTWDYGDGDPRLFVDTASGYFYVTYGSRINPKGGAGGSSDGLAHVARAPMSGKMATGTWTKWYNGSWSQPGIGGLESNQVPVTSANPDGYTPVSGDYNPANTGNVDQQIAAGTLPAKSPLFVMNISYDAYLGLYIGTPEAIDSVQPQQFYVTDNLATQKWYLAGDTGSGYQNQSWYRWLVDSANATNSTIIGKTFRYYCSVSCANGSGGQYTNMTVASTSPAAPPVDLTKTYTIGNGSGRVLTQVSGGTATTSAASATGSNLQAWSFVADSDGSYNIVNAGTGQALGVDSTNTANRAWATAPTATNLGSGGGTVGQQWFIVADKSSSGTADGTFRLVNRYSGLVLGMSSTAGRLSETTPTRSWTNTTGNSVGGTRTAADQTLTFTQSGSTGSETVTVGNPGAQTGTVGTAVSLQITGSDSAGKALTYSATGLPAGLSVSSSGLISGTPTTAGTSTVTVTASSGTASGSTSFSWTVGTSGGGGGIANGTHTVSLSGVALDDPNWSTATGVQMDTWSVNGGANQNWVFTRQSDGTYTIANAYSNLCLDDSGNSLSAGGAIIQWTCSGAGNQKWTATALSGGGYTLANQKSGLLLTTSSTSDGGLVTQQAATGSALQHWTIN